MNIHHIPMFGGRGRLCYGFRCHRAGKEEDDRLQHAGARTEALGRATQT